MKRHIVKIHCEAPAKTRIEIDGKEVKGVCGFRLEQDVKSPPFLTLYLIPEKVEVEGQPKIIAELLDKKDVD